VKIIAALAAALALAACQTASEPAPSPTPVSTTSSDGTLTLRVSTPERIAGSYVDPAGLGVDFDTARADDGLYMHVATRSGHVLIDARTTPTSYVFAYLDGRLTLEVDKAWVNLVRLEGPDGAAASDDGQMHGTGDRNVLDEMLALPEARLLPELSRSLGALGITGSAYPASLALHKIARQSADALAIDVAPIAAPTAEGSFCQAYPNAGDQCYGMCGNGCSCWSWVCGDCCYHGGCAQHDTWCRQGKWWYCYNITAVVALFGC
jgi:hypothetical protein